MKIKLVDLGRKSDGIIMVKLVGEDRNEVMQGIPGIEGDVINDDTLVVRGFERVHGGHGFGKRNEAGEKFLDFGAANALTIINTYFRKRGEKVKVAAKVMEKIKAVVLDGVPIGMWKILGDVSIVWLKDLLNKMLIQKIGERILLYHY
ncbi:unnamed protein product [Aphis gossypii]|uniref:Uncharacterized protein n=1 Tax=Aphis gossypii TaxID=80765 RepID=A0A9P0IZV2_APHGO|nr:unnamed protein product [Aphis gossypii]